MSNSKSALRLLFLHSDAQPAPFLPHQRIVLIQDKLNFGRDKAFDARIRLKEIAVSKTHATIFYDADLAGYAVVDVGSTQGTFVASMEGSEASGELGPEERLSEPKQASYVRSSQG